MFDFDMLLQMLLALAGGIVLGLEREKFFKTHKTGHPLVAGVRTFTLIALLGFLSAMVTEMFATHWIMTGTLLALVILIGISYYIGYTKYEQAGMTTEVAMILTYVMGALVFFGYQELAVALVIILMLVLSLHRQSKILVKRVSTKEIIDSVKFGIIAFIILPLLPNEYYGYLDAFNPHETWLMVVVVSGIGFIGYVLTKIVGTKKGVGLTGFIGGLVSSTAVTTSLSQLSKKAKNINPFVFGVLLSSVVAFIRVALEVFVFNKALFYSLVIPLAVMALVGLLIAARYFWIRPGETLQETDVNVSSPFAFKPALFFGFFFALIIFISKISLEHLPTESLYIVSLLSGLADVDAITLTVSRLEGLATSTGTIAILVAVASNMVVKGAIAYMFGARKYAMHIVLIFSILIAAGIGTALFV